MAEPVQRDGKRVGLIAFLRFKPPASPHFGGWRRVQLQLAGHDNCGKAGSSRHRPHCHPVVLHQIIRVADGVVTLFLAKTNLAEAHLAEMKKA